MREPSEVVVQLFGTTPINLNSVKFAENSPDNGISFNGTDLGTSAHAIYFLKLFKGVPIQGVVILESERLRKNRGLVAQLRRSSATVRRLSRSEEGLYHLPPGILESKKVAVIERTGGRMIFTP